MPVIETMKEKHKKLSHFPKIRKWEYEKSKDPQPLKVVGFFTFETRKQKILIKTYLLHLIYCSDKVQ
jgi:hypothetical protein